MTKKWSATKSLDGQTKRQASKKKRRENKKIKESSGCVFADLNVECKANHCEVCGND